jgi:hypothetical protein
MQARSAFLGRSTPIAICVMALATVSAGGRVTPEAEKNDKPTITVKASPAVGFAPMRVVMTAELKGGPNDYEEFYCASVEWDIGTANGVGDGNKSEQKIECDPYEAGKSEIRRLYVRDQVFRTAGEYKVQFSLKQKNKTVGSGRTTVRIRPGIGDGFSDR